MSTKGDRTREMIVQRSAALFNLHGYAGTAMSDIIDKTGIQKGGIYRHFESKEAIALEAFAYALHTLYEEVYRLVEGDQAASDKLRAISRIYLALYDNTALPGGCPILNTAVEVDDSESPLKQKAQEGLNTLRDAIQQVIAQSKQSGIMPATVDGDSVATVIISLCEGALMMSKLLNDPTHLHRAITHLDGYIATLMTP
jgi:TetR/AcrR family transcriptional regulator, transcriptional repressor for nem operon